MLRGPSAIAGQGVMNGGGDYLPSALFIAAVAISRAKDFDWLGSAMFLITDTDS